VEFRVLLEAPSLILATLRFAPQGSIDEHAAEFDIDVVCLSGEGFVSVGAERGALRSGERVHWPKGTDHCLWTETSAMETLMVEHRG
jgi:quercetin dioxygenase-like cupin family protein